MDRNKNYEYNGEIFSKRFNEIKELRHLTLKEISENTKISTKTLSMYLNGEIMENGKTKYKAPGADSLFKLSKCLNISVDYLIGASDYRCTLPYNELLKYLIENNIDSFIDYFKSLESAALHHAQITIKEERESKRVNDINELPPEQYHRNLVKMKSWLEEYGDIEYLMRAAIQSRIKNYQEGVNPFE